MGNPDASRGTGQQDWYFLAFAVISLAIIGYLDSLSELVSQSLLYGLLCTAAGYRLSQNGAVVTVLACIGVHFFAHSRSLLQWENELQTVSEAILLGVVAYLAYNLRRRQDALEFSRTEIATLHNSLLSHLERARQVQREILGVLPENIDHFDLCVQFEVAVELGGDLFFVREVPGGLFLYLGDVSGKGPKAAIAAACVRVLLDEIVTDHPSPAQVLTQLQNRFMRLLPGDLFITSFCALALASEQSLLYANAGHDPPLLKRDGSPDLEELTSESMPLGVDANECFFERSVPFQPGDCLLVYTDGLIDAHQAGGERLGIQAVENALAQSSDTGEQLAQSLVQMAPEPRCDDVMVMVLTHKKS